jgi:hypothetical protein
MDTTKFPVIESQLKYLTSLRESKQVEIFDFKPLLTRKFPNLSPKEADAIFRIWLIENPFKYLEK